MRNFASIGVELAVETLPFEDFFGAFEDPTGRVGVFGPVGWARTTHGPVEFLYPYHSEVPDGSLVGASAQELETWVYETRDVPSIDDRLEACVPVTGAQQFECWAALDQHVMENVVPLIPYGSELLVVLVSPRVVEYSFDELVGAPALDQIALRP